MKSFDDHISKELLLDISAQALLGQHTRTYTHAQYIAHNNQ